MSGLDRPQPAKFARPTQIAGERESEILKTKSTAQVEKTVMLPTSHNLRAEPLLTFDVNTSHIINEDGDEEQKM